MAIELIGAAGFTPELKQFYEKELLMRAVPALVHMNWGIKRSLPPQGGKSIEWRRLDTIAASTTALTEGTPPSETNVTFTAISGTVSQYGMYTKISDVAWRQSFDNVPIRR